MRDFCFSSSKSNKGKGPEELLRQNKKENARWISFNNYITRAFVMEVTIVYNDKCLCNSPLRKQNFGFLTTEELE